MQKKLLITKAMGGIVTALFHDGRAVELSVEPAAQTGLLGNLYVGKVANIVKNIHAAFVEIEDGIPCYLDLEKNPAPMVTSRAFSGKLAAGDELIVQVSRESAKTKAPTVTTELSFTGKYLVLVLGKGGVSFSSKLDRQEKERLKELFAAEISAKAQADGKENLPEFGWIVRTNAAQADGEELRREKEALERRCIRLLEKAGHLTCRSCLYRTPPEYLNRIRDLRSGEFEEILTDDGELYEEISNWLRTEQPKDLERLRLYQDRLLPMGKLYSLKTAFSDAVKERAWLKSGGYLVIQPTEALTVIDVNTGKYDGSKKLADTFLKINLEAAREAAAQMRLRNLSGIIIIDFINMKKQEHRDQVMRELAQALSADPCKAVLVDMTPLGLVEVTRKRARKPLAEQLERELLLELKNY